MHSPSPLGRRHYDSGRAQGFIPELHLPPNWREEVRDGNEQVLVALEAEVDALIAAGTAAKRILQELRRQGKGRPSAERRAKAPREKDLRRNGMTVAEAAVALNYSEEYVRRLLRQGQMVGVPYGGRTGWRLSRGYVAQIANQIAVTKEGQTAAREQLARRTTPSKQSMSAADSQDAAVLREPARGAA